MDRSRQVDTDQIGSLGDTVMKPGLIWACSGTPCHSELIDEVPSADCGFRWLHLNLADQRSLRWIERAVTLPPAIHETFISQETRQRGLVDQGFVALVLHDFERDFDRQDTGTVGALHVVVGPRIMLTGRYHPPHTSDVVRQRISAGAVVDNPAAVADMMLGGIADTLEGRVRDIHADLLAAEDDLLDDGTAPATRELVTVRRLCAQLHRMIAGARAALHRVEGDPALDPDLAPCFARASQRLQALDAEVVAAQTQLRLLRDELDLQAAQRTSRNIFFLSVMTALMMPATLVTPILRSG